MTRDCDISTLKTSVVFKTLGTLQVLTVWFIYVSALHEKFYRRINRNVLFTLRVAFS